MRGLPPRVVDAEESRRRHPRRRKGLARVPVRGPPVQDGRRDTAPLPGVAADAARHVPRDAERDGRGRARNAVGRRRGRRDVRLGHVAQQAVVGQEARHEARARDVQAARFRHPGARARRRPCLPRARREEVDDHADHPGDGRGGQHHLLGWVPAVPGNTEARVPARVRRPRAARVRAGRGALERHGGLLGLPEARAQDNRRDPPR